MLHESLGTTTVVYRGCDLSSDAMTEEAKKMFRNDTIWVCVGLLTLSVACAEIAHASSAAERVALPAQASAEPASSAAERAGTLDQLDEDARRVDRNHSFLQKVSSDLDFLGNQISSFRSECSPPFYSNWAEHFRAITARLRSAGAPRSLDGGQPAVYLDESLMDDIDRQLEVLHAAISFHRLHMLDSCSMYDAAQEDKAASDEGQAERWAFLDEGIAALWPRLLSVLGVVQEHYSEGYLDCNGCRGSFMWVKVKRGDPLDFLRHVLVANQGQVDQIRYEAPRPKTSTIRHRTGWFIFSTTVRDHFRRTMTQEVYSVTFERRTAIYSNQEWSSWDDIEPAARYLDYALPQIQAALTRACMDRLGVWQGNLVRDMLSTLQDVDDRRKLRAGMERIVNSVGAASACEPGSRRIEADLKSLLDDFAAEESASVESVSMARYVEKFDRIDWIGRRIMEFGWVRRVLSPDFASDRALLDKLYERYEAEHVERDLDDIDYRRAVERSIRENAAKLDLAKEETNRETSVARIETTGLVDATRIEADALVERAKIQRQSAEAERDRAILDKIIGTGARILGTSVGGF